MPFKGLDRTFDPELYLGLVHVKDGLAATVARINTANVILSDFGIATECGIARARMPETIATFDRRLSKRSRQFAEAVGPSSDHHGTACPFRSTKTSPGFPNRSSRTSTIKGTLSSTPNGAFGPPRSVRIQPGAIRTSGR